jgi:hypothetical protein
VRPTPRRGIAMLGVVLALVLLGMMALPTTSPDTQLGTTRAAASTSEPAPPPADAWVGTLRPGEQLRDEAAGGNTLSHQRDGNVVLRNVDGHVIWQTGTHGRATSRLVQQTDGNFVLYDSANRPIFASGTTGTGARLTLQGDANLVLYGADPQTAVRWASRHWPPPPPEPTGGTPAENRQLGYHMLADRGWAHQFSCLDRLWSHESGWSQYADNPSSSAYGIPQALPGSKMSTHGDDWATNPRVQIAWGLDYIFGRYGSPCAANNHALSTGWY